MKKSESPPSVAPGGGPADPLDELFRRARGDGFSREEASELWSRTGAAVGLGAPAPRVESGTAAGSSASVGGAVGAVGVHVKTIVAFLIGGGLAVVGAVHLHGTPGQTERPVAGVAVPAQASPVGPAAAVAESPQPVDVTDLPAAAGPSGPSGQPRVASRGVAPPGAERRDGVRATSASRLAEPAGAFLAEPVREVAPRSAAAAAALAGPAAPAASPRPDSASSQGASAALAAPALEPPPTEGALLLQARRELASDPAGTLALTAEHARRFPGGALAPEREVLAIEALARLGRTAEADKRLDVFRARYPQSPHVARLAGLIARP